MRAASLLLTAAVADAGFNNMARTPPMGWRSWNGFGCNISEPDILTAARGLADTSRGASLLSLGYSNVGLDDCYQMLLVDSCRYPGSGASLSAAGAAAPRRAPCSDPNASFPVPLPGQCQGLAGPLPGVATAAACAAACCADASCTVWQFCAAGGCSGSQAPASSCYTGQSADCDMAGSGWAGAGVQVPPYTFHSAVTGRTVVNATRFPSLRGMTDAVHALGLTAGFYMNNCFCHDHCVNRSCYEGDAAVLVEAGFDTVKFDGCGTQHNMTLWTELLAASPAGPTMVIENCNNDNALIPAKGGNLSACPFHFYRSSTDIRPTYGSVMNNAQTVLHLHTGSGPGTWSYPDMLEVGVTAQILTAPKIPPAPRAHWGEGTILRPGSPAYAALLAAPLPPVLSLVENRAHFSLWCILSSPLTLSLNFSDAAVVDAVWPIIANPEAIAINQAWAGSMGAVISESAETVILQHCAWLWAGDPNCTLPVEQVYVKPISSTAVALIVLNHGDATRATAVPLASVPGLACAPGPCTVRDVNARADLPPATGSLVIPALASHDVAFFVLGK